MNLIQQVWEKVQEPEFLRSSRSYSDDHQGLNAIANDSLAGVEGQEEGIPPLHQ